MEKEIKAINDKVKNDFKIMFGSKDDYEDHDCKIGDGTGHCDHPSHGNYEGDESEEADESFPREPIANENLK